MLLELILLSFLGTASSLSTFASGSRISLILSCLPFQTFFDGAGATVPFGFFDFFSEEDVEGLGPSTEEVGWGSLEATMPDEPKIFSLRPFQTDGLLMFIRCVITVIFSSLETREGFDDVKQSFGSEEASNTTQRFLATIQAQ